MKIEHAARLYAEGSITLERAAMDAGTSVREDGIPKTKEDTSSIQHRGLREDMKNFYKK